MADRRAFLRRHLLKLWGGSRKAKSLSGALSFGNSGTECRGRIKKPGACRRQAAGVLSRRQHPGQYVPELPVQVFSVWSSLNWPIIRVLNCPVALSMGNMPRLRPPRRPSTRQLPMDIAGQRCHIGDPRDMLLFFKNRLVQMGNAPPLGDIETEQLHQRCAGFPRSSYCARCGTAQAGYPPDQKP